MKSYSAIKRSEVLTHTTCVTLKNITTNERIQSQKAIDCMILPLGNKQCMETDNGLGVASVWGRSCQERKGNWL
jgi:hypothetical protein